MKKISIFCLAALLALSVSFSFADESFQSMWGEEIKTFDTDQLYALREIVNREILSRSEYESVAVPPGFYVVGEDIPVGHWSIKYSPGEYCLVEYFLNTDATGKRPADLFEDYYYDGICDPQHEMSAVYSLTEIDLDLQPGYHVVINYGSAVFEPFTGRPSPFF